MVTQKYIDERPDWVISACNKCGLAELFDAPSDLVRVVFPDMPKDAISTMFTARCGNCGGFQVVRSRRSPEGEGSADEPVEKEPWWQSRQ
jgi:hypothetical protein